MLQAGVYPWRVSGIRIDQRSGKGVSSEIVCSEEKKADQLQELIRSFDIDAKIVTRKKSYVVYVKEGAQIVEMLAVMEANVSLMNLENINDCQGNAKQRQPESKL